MGGKTARVSTVTIRCNIRFMLTGGVRLRNPAPELCPPSWAVHPNTLPAWLRQATAGPLGQTGRFVTERTAERISRMARWRERYVGGPREGGAGHCWEAHVLRPGTDISSMARTLPDCSIRCNLQLHNSSRHSELL